MPTLTHFIANHQRFVMSALVFVLVAGLRVAFGLRRLRRTRSFYRCVYCGCRLRLHRLRYCSRHHDRLDSRVINDLAVARLQDHDARLGLAVPTEPPPPSDETALPQLAPYLQPARLANYPFNRLMGIPHPIKFEPLDYWKTLQQNFQNRRAAR
ncbi:MAG TPA: hypothetical protein VGN17_26165 [Bryobacteraceae bacterium]|jgi:hypothetical protein